MTVSRTFVFWLSLGVTAGVAASNEPATYQVGVASVDITPRYPIRLNGFGGRREESDGITQPIWAKALAIQWDDQRPVVLLTVDSTGLPLAMVEEVAKRLKDSSGVAREGVCVTFTHTHTAPKITGVCDTVFSTSIPAEHQAHIDRYTRELTDALYDVATAALKNMRPANLTWAVGKVTFAKNRRTEGGPVDHSLPILVVKSPDGEIVAIYVTYACHCVTLSNNQIGGDWAGYAQAAIERKYPGAVALVSIGCGSDSNPSSGVAPDNFAAAAEQGDEIAEETERLLRGSLRPISGEIRSYFNVIDLPLNPPPSRAELEKAAATDDPIGYNAKFQLAKLDRGEPLQTALAYPVQTWAFGDSLAMTFLGGEVCVDYAIRLRQEIDAARIWLHGYSNDLGCYVPSERLLREGGYGGGGEVIYFALPSTLKTGVEQKIVDEVHRQIPPNFKTDDSSRQSSQAPTHAGEVVASMEIADEFVAELVVSEPLVVDPVAIDFGPDGRLWVAEMRNYGHEVDDEFKQSGRITALRDSDGDGRFDESVNFIDRLRFPTDVKCWRDGVIVCDAPDVIYWEDEDGDGRADRRKVLLTGFATINPQARVNSLRWGIDNWVYGSCGLFGGVITSWNGTTLELGGRDFRFQPDSGAIEPVSGRTQQGRVCDDWGNWFGSDSGTLLRHYPVIERYLARNPHISPPPTEVFVPGGSDPSRLFPRGNLVMFKESGSPGRPTSVCGVEIYRDDLLGAEFRGNAFAAEPVNQLVHRMVLAPHGATFVGKRADEETNREFLASSNQWFRPVQIRTGFDGSLWIVDMCRMVIEHRRFIPAETLEKVDVFAGASAGRIYRVRRKDKVPRPVVRFDKLPIDGLVAELGSPNGPRRDMAQQILIQRSEAAAVPLVEKMCENPRAEVRLQALYTLAGLGGLNPPVLRKALQDSHPAVRQHAVRLSEEYFASVPDLVDAVLSLSTDPDAKVRMQVGYSLGECGEPRAAMAIAEHAWANQGDPYQLSAALSSIDAQNARVVIDRWCSKATEASLLEGMKAPFISVVATLGDAASVRDALRFLTRKSNGSVAEWQLDLLADLLKTLKENGRIELVDESKSPAEMRDAIVALARDTLESHRDNERRVMAAVRVLATVSPQSIDSATAIADLIGPQCSPAVQRQAVDLLMESGSSDAFSLILERWGSYTPALRMHVLDGCCDQLQTLRQLLQELERGNIPSADIDALHRQRMLSHDDPTVRQMAQAAFAGAIDPDRQRIVKLYSAASLPAADAAHGRQVFQKHCASCHQLEGYGYKVGPDLAAITNRSTAYLLEAIFDPNRTVDERYRSYAAITTEGVVHTGIVVQETSNSITLLEQNGKETVLLRSNLDDLQISKMSLMPEGFERDISARDASDLLAYLVAQGQPPKTFPGNTPAVVHADSAGVIRLLAENCEIYGDTIRFEMPHRNLGYWHSASNYVTWRVHVDKKQEYQVYLDWASADDSAGNVLLIEGLAEPVREVVQGTGGWDKYSTKAIGTMELVPGVHRICARGDSLRAGSNLIDMRGIYLVPEGATVDFSIDATGSD